MQNHTHSSILNVNDAASYLRISRANLYRLFKTGELNFAKLGSRTLVRREDADALVNRSLKLSPPSSTPGGDIFE